MARGNGIVVNADPRGHYEWGYVTPAARPGTILQINPAVAVKAGKHTWVAYDRDVDGDRPKGPFAVLDFDQYQGRDAATAYAAGDFCKLYIPEAGDELNLLTDAAITAGDILIADDGTGKVVVTTGAVETEVAVALETVGAAANTLVWARWSGH